MICFFKQKAAYELRISDWSSDVCSSDLALVHDRHLAAVDLTAVGEAIGHRYPVRSANRLDATLMYLRAASWAQATALSSGSSSRKIGRASCRERVCQSV